MRLDMAHVGDVVVSRTRCHELGVLLGLVRWFASWGGSSWFRRSSEGIPTRRACVGWKMHRGSCGYRCRCRCGEGPAVDVCLGGASARCGFVPVFD